MMWFVRIAMIAGSLALPVCANCAAAEKPKLDQYAKLGEPLSESEATSQSDSKLAWYPAQKLTVVGQGFDDPATWSSRLPERYLDKVSTSVRQLSSNCAGVALRFATDSDSLGAAWDSVPPMDHMARTGSAGLDLYERRDAEWKYKGTGFPRTTNTVTTIRGRLSEELTEYLLYLPLYSPVKDLKLGIKPGCRIIPVTDTRKDRLPVVFYGTSMTQGGCASRSGMCHVAILGRWLDRETINLGFSGAGKSEPVMGDLLAEIPASVYVLEPLPNMNAEGNMVPERIPVLVRKLRAAHPTTPILLVQNPLTRNDSQQNRLLTNAFKDLKKEGLRDLHLLPAEGQLAGKENGTVDGVHPTDLGFNRMAECYFPVLKRLLGEK